MRSHQWALICFANRMETLLLVFPMLFDHATGILSAGHPRSFSPSLHRHHPVSEWKATHSLSSLPLNSAPCSVELFIVQKDRALCP